MYLAIFAIPHEQPMLKQTHHLLHHTLLEFLWRDILLVTVCSCIILLITRCKLIQLLAD